MESQVTGFTASLGCAVRNTAGLQGWENTERTAVQVQRKSAGERERASVTDEVQKQSLPAQVGWNQGDLILLSHLVLVEGEVMFLSITGAWKFSWGVHYPITALQREALLFHSFSKFPGSSPPSLLYSCPFQSKCGTWKAQGGRKWIQGPWYRRRDTGLRDDTAVPYQSSPFRTKKQEAWDKDVISHDSFLLFGSLSAGLQNQSRFFQ